MKTHRLFFAGMLTAALLTPNACSKDDTTLANTPLPQETTATAGTLTVKFDYTHYPTLATGQYAIWIENATGQLVRTVFVTRFTGRGGFNNRPDCCPTWVSKANPQSHNSDEVDGYTGATPQNGRQQYVWDGKATTETWWPAALTASASRVRSTGRAVCSIKEHSPWEESRHRWHSPSRTRRTNRPTATCS